MPHIKSIRLVNIHFNNATQFYDDFKMELGGKNATYDLENGGGKSLLLLMILQTVLPKSFLRKEKPISLLFQGGKDRTSHVAVEWILEEGSQYKYLLTGFSARKKKGSNDAAAREANEEDENLLSGDIEHLNWCVFSNDNKTTGIKAVPLCREEAGKKFYSTFDEIRKYIQQTKQKGIPADVFDGIDRYQSFIAAHHLIAAEWNIIKGINSGENNIESYFRQNPTSRKLIENQFVKIIEDIEALNKGERNHDESLLLADTLIEIRNRLNEYLRLKGHMTEFEKIKEVYLEFGRKNEELLEGFSRYEAYKSQAAGVRNLIGNRLKQLEARKMEALNKKDYVVASCREGIILSKHLEAGLVQYGIRGLEAEKVKLEEEEKRLIDAQKELESKYNELMTLEGYGEYRKTKGKLYEAEQSLSILENDKDDLNSQYRSTGGRLKHLLGRNLKEGILAEEQLKAALKGFEEGKKVNQEALIREERSESALKAQIDPLEKQEKLLHEKIDLLQKLFLKNGEMDAIMNPGGLLTKIEEQRKTLEARHLQAGERINAIDDRTQTLEVDTVKINSEIRLREDTKNRDEEWLGIYQKELAELEKKASGFEKRSLEEYREELELCIRRESLGKLEQEIEVGRLQQKKQLSGKRDCYVPNEELLSFAEQLSDKCEYVKAGIDWIAESDKEMREALLKEMPFLPFSVIIDGKSFEKLKTGKVKIDFASDYLIPVVNLDTVRAMRDSAKGDLFYFCSFTELLLDDDRFRQYMEGIDVRLEGLGREIETSGKRVEALNTDLRKLTAFLENYAKEKVEDTIGRVQRINHEIDVLKNKQQQVEKEKVQLISEKSILREQLEELEGLLKAAKEKSEKLQSLITIQEELTNIRKGLSSKKKEQETVIAAIRKIKEEAERLEVRYARGQEELKSLSLQLHDLKKEHEQLESFVEIDSSEPLEEVRAEYKAKLDVVSGRIANENKLREDIEDYKSRLKELKNRISRDYSGDLERLSENEGAGARIIIPTQDSIGKAKSDKEDAGVKLKDLEGKINKVSVKISKAEGKLGEILKDVTEAQKAELPSYEIEARYEEEIKYTRQLVSSYEEELENLENELDKIKGEDGKLNMQAEQYDSFIIREGVNDDGSIAADIKEFRGFENEFLNLQKIIRNQCEKWDDRIKVIHEETGEYIIREPLEELAKISRPETAGQCRDRRKAFNEYIMNIEEQMQKISNDLLQLESYQQDFTRRCIQRAELVLGHLRKLESLSRIEVYGRRTNMVELKLQEFEEKEKQLRMKNHIDGIVREISEEGIVDRKRVAAKLSTKELLAQITDMDKAAVRLYKIESIPENSRFYRWEHAIGSEGQNNSLYFIFAACLISFIRMLSITNTSLRTKKVIIADNPFGATSAVYLWDPMFKIMKQNDIQLIAPGHRIPREITSRFGVSYLLNQDILQDGRMRVVVKDVRVEEDEDVMRYVDPEQLSLF